MQINITFRRFEATDSLRQYALEKMERVKKHLSRPEAAEAHIVLSLERHLQHADITLYSQGKLVRGHESTNDMYAAIDLAVERLERQLKRYRDKIRHHHDRALVHHGRSLIQDGNGSVEEAAPPPESRRENPRDGRNGHREEPRLLLSEEPVPMLTPDEAVTQLQLLDREFMAFTNKKNKRACVVYRRKDGHFGLIDLGGAAAGRSKEARL